jgi:hypothetical protein
VPLQRDNLKSPEVARVVVGFYNPENGEQLPARAISDEPVDFVIAGEVRVSPATASVLPTPAQQVEAEFEQGVTLAGYEWSTPTAKAGDSIVLTVWWQAQGALPESYTVFAHLLNRDGGLLAQADQQPRHGRYPTTFWQPGETIVDTHTFVIPAETAAGDTQVWLGLYWLADNRRLQREPGAEPADAVVLPGPVVVP